MARPVRPWFRFYTEAFNDRKMLRLSPVQRWIWVAVLGAARESPEAGSLYIAEGVPMTYAELARFADVREVEVRKAASTMASLGMITVEADVITVTNWGHRQFESDDVSARTQAHRERSKEQPKEQDRNVPTNVRRNAPETETETETEKTSSSADADGPDRFDEFWSVYPRKVSKKTAQTRWQSLMKRKVSPQVIIDGARRYAASQRGVDLSKVKHPDGWLNGERWEDEASVTPIRQRDERDQPAYETPPAPDWRTLPW